MTAELLAYIRSRPSEASAAERDGYSSQAAQLAEPPAKTGDRSRFADGATFVLDSPAEVPAVWGAGPQVLWAAGESLMIDGPVGVGKTTLAGQLIRGRLGLQDSLLGLSVRPGAKKVLYLACDRPPQVARSLRRLFTEADRDVLAEKLVVWRGPPAADFARSPETLLEMCQSADADTCVIDSIKDVALQPSTDETGSGYNNARQRALAGGVELLELHHQRKASSENRKPSTLDDVYGSVWLTAGAGSVLLLWGAPGDLVVELSHIKQPSEAVGPLRLVHDHVNGTTEVWAQLDVYDLVRRQPRGATAPEVARVMFDTGSPQPNQIEKARRKLESLVATGRLHKRPGSGGGEHGGEATRYFTVVPVEEG